MFSPRHASATQGFTLIEVLVVLGMLGILAGMLAINARGVRETRNLDIAVDEVVSTLRQVQAWGDTGRSVPAEVVANGDVSDAERYDRGYGVHFDQDATSILVYFGFGADRDTSRVAKHNRYDPDNLVETVQLPRGVTVSDISIDGVAGPNELHVLVRRGRVRADEETVFLGSHSNGTSHNYRSAAEITLASGSLTRTVYVNKYGLIYAD